MEIPFEQGVELTTDHPESHYGCPVLIVYGDPYGPSDALPLTAAESAGVYGAQYVVERASEGDWGRERLEYMRRYCAQWPAGPQVVE